MVSNGTCSLATSWLSAWFANTVSPSNTPYQGNGYTCRRLESPGAPDSRCVGGATTVSFALYEIV
jgi:hypothetical protein